MFVSYAQNFEDVMLWRALKHVERGCYIDIGAQHPRVDSVSRAFYERGWRGVHMEPVPEFAALLREDRPDELVLEAAVAEVAGSRMFHILEDTGLSTFDAELAGRHECDGRYARRELVVPTLTLTQVFETAQQPQTHWLKIDVEGAEREVLAGWDSGRWRPWIVVIESTVPNTEIDDSDRWEALILSADYRFAYLDGLNRWYIRRESAEELAAAFRTPPNFFDGFVRAQEVASEREAARLAQELAALKRYHPTAMLGAGLAKLSANVQHWKSLAHRFFK
jgi:FkbM family methyltransferase